MNVDTIIMALVAAFCGYQWYGWRKRAINMHKAHAAHQQKSNAGDEILRNLHEERQRNHDALMGAFDYINDNSSREDTGLMQVKNVLAYAIQNSTFGRG